MPWYSLVRKNRPVAGKLFRVMPWYSLVRKNRPEAGKLFRVV